MQMTTQLRHIRILFRSYLLISRNFIIFINPSRKLENLLKRKFQERREENEVDEGDEGKHPDDIYKNLEKLKSVEDRMTYTHYSQQEDWIIKI